LTSSAPISLNDRLNTYVEHIALQLCTVIRKLCPTVNDPAKKMLVTGGGAFNNYLIERLSSLLEPMGINVIIPDPALISYKEAAIMAFIGVLRWRQEINVMASVTGAIKDSVGGALWIGE
jgi:anhydro-N-acetylmuramic acid kinase